MAGGFFRPALLDDGLSRPYFPLPALGLSEQRRPARLDLTSPAPLTAGSRPGEPGRPNTEDERQATGDTPEKRRITPA